MRYLPYFALLMLFAAALNACHTSRSTNALSFQTETNTYRPGDTVEVRLENETDQAVGYNICFGFLTLEQRSGDAWETVRVGLGPDPNAACTAQLNGLPPGDRAESTAYLPADLAAGMYRLTTDVERNSARERLATDPFEVQR